MSENERKMKILMLLPSFGDPFMHPVYHSMFKDMIAEHFPNMGHEIIWITEQRDKPNKKQIINWRGIRCYIMKAPFGNGGNLCKFANTFFIYIDKYFTLRKVTRNEKIDVIQVRNSILDGLLAQHFKKRNKSIVIYQLSFPFAEGMIQYPQLSYRKLHAFAYIQGKLSEVMVKWMLLKADHIFSISKWMKRDLVDEGIPEHKIFPLPLGCNPIKERNGDLIRKKYGLDGFRTLIYIGNMDKKRNLVFLIKTFEIVKNEIKDVKMLMVGSGNDKINLEKVTKNKGLDEDIIFTGFIERDMIPDYIAAADIGLSPIIPFSIYKISSPIKIFEYMIMGIPIVANKEIPEQKEVLEESGGGILVKFEGDSFAKGIIELLDNPTEAKKIGIKGRTWVIKNRSYENMARGVEKRYLKLLKSHSRR